MLNYMKRMIKSLEPVSYEIVRKTVSIEDIEKGFSPIGDSRLDVIATGLYDMVEKFENESKTYSIADLAIMYDTPIEYIEEGLSKVERLGYIRKKQ